MPLAHSIEGAAYNINLNTPMKDYDQNQIDESQAEEMNQESISYSGKLDSQSQKSHSVNKFGITSE